MKGTIVRCLEEVVRKHGDSKWQATLVAAGFPANKHFLMDDNVADEQVLTLIGAAAKVLGISQAQAHEAFGEHWSYAYAPKTYAFYFEQAKTARQFFLNLADVHVKITKRMANAAPPVFTYDDSDPERLVMNYQSKRGLVALVPGLARGIAKYYKEQIDVGLTGNRVTIRFLSAASKRKAA